VGETRWAGASARALMALAVVGALAAALVPPVPASAQASGITISRSTVPTGEDFATMLYGDPWDYDNREDIRFLQNRTINAQNARLEQSELRWSVAQGQASLHTFVFPGYGGALYMNRDGGAKPIDATRYTHVAMRIFLGASQDRAMSFNYDRCLAPEGTTAFCRETTGNVILRPGWNTVVEDLRTLTAGRAHPWTGRVYGFRMSNGQGDYRVAYLRLQTAPEEVEVTWDASQGQTLIWDRDADRSNNTPTSEGWGIVGTGGRARFPAGAMEPGQYRFAVQGSATYSEPLTVRARPAPFVLDPDLAGGEDYATAHLGRPWDFTSSNDIIARGNWVGSFGPTGLHAQNAANHPELPRMNDPYFYLRLDRASDRGAIDPNRYHRLTVHTTFQGPFNLEDIPGGGTHGRLLWTHAGRNQDRVIQGNRLIESREMVHYPDEASFTVDLKTPPDPRFLMETDRPERDGWAAGHPITHIRYDPNEDRGPRRWHMRRIELRATDEARGGFDIRWRDAAATQPVTVAIHYRPEAGGDWRLVADGIQQRARQVNTYRWVTTGVPAGRYVVRVTGHDGVSSAANVSTGPVDVRPSIRIAGSDRHSTGVALSQAAFRNGAPAAVIARSTQFPDALAAAPLASAAGGPLLLNPTDDLQDVVAQELRRLGVQRVYVMGGDRAISPRVVQQIQALGGIQVTRIAGSDRFETAAAAADEAVRLWRAAGHTDAGRRAIVALGEDFPDALAAGPLAGHDRRVLLLSSRGRAADATVAALDRLGTTQVTIVGGTAAVSDAAASGYRSTGRTVTRIAGSTRHETAELAARAAVNAGATDKVVIVASGRQFPDALAAGPAAQRLNGVLLLTERDSLPGVTGAWVHGRRPLQLLRVAGGPAAVSNRVEDQLMQLAR
jgi:putative cell wall-binding protein